MSKVIVNLTLELIGEEIELFLDTHPLPVYQKLFANPDLIQELTAYILGEIPSVYAVVEEKREKLNSQRLSKSLEQRMYVEALIQIGIEQILAKKAPDSKQLLSCSKSGHFRQFNQSKLAKLQGKDVNNTQSFFN